MPPIIPAGKPVTQFLGNFDLGINSGVEPLQLPANQLSFATNVSLRGQNAHPRPPFFTRTMTFPSTEIETAVTTGLWQGAGYYRPDTGLESLIAQISGRLFLFVPQLDDTVTVTEITVIDPMTGLPDPNSATAPQAWLWQSEKWMIVENGVAGVNPIFYDGTTSVRSNFGTKVPEFTTLTAPFTVPNIGSNVVLAFTSVTDILVGDTITVKNYGQAVVLSIAANNVTVVNQTMQFPGAVVNNPSDISWFHLGNELPPGRMGVYGMGRNWLSLVDGEQFVAGDLVGGASGTIAENYRDAVLKITENTYLAGGGNFFVPGGVGQIQAMIFQALLDQQLGQGPLLVVTPKVTFSCQAPLDRLTWSSLQNPIVTEGMIANGGLSQNSTIAVNGDTIMRAIDGIRSLILARRDFNTWGNTPISFEMNRVLAKDTLALLPFGSAIFFDNRLLMTVAPTASDHGVYHSGLASLNADPVSSISGKAPSIWEGIWIGITPLQLVSGLFSTVERAWAFCFNTVTSKIELRELLAEATAFNDAEYYDDGILPITYSFETAGLFKDKEQGGRVFKQLYNGEIFVDQVAGQVNFKVQYRPDQWPGWVDWHEWQICSLQKVVADPTTQNYQPGFNPRMGLGQPDYEDCDPCNDRPFPLGYSYQLKVIVTGQAQFHGARLTSITQPEPEFAEPICQEICEVPEPTAPRLNTIRTTCCPQFAPSNMYSSTLSVTGGTAPFVYSVVGDVDLVQDNPLTATITRTCTAGPPTEITVTVVDANGLQDVRTFSIYSPSILADPPHGQVGVLYGPVQLEIQNGNGPFSNWHTVPGGFTDDFGPGMTLSPEGVLSGVPTVAGDYEPDTYFTSSDGVTCKLEPVLIIDP